MTLKATTSLFKQNASLLHLFLMYKNDKKKNTFIQVILEQFFFFSLHKITKTSKKHHWIGLWWLAAPAVS